jgi:hypothetical protein
VAGSQQKASRRPEIRRRPESEASQSQTDRDRAANCEAAPTNKNIYKNNTNYKRLIMRESESYPGCTATPARPRGGARGRPPPRARAPLPLLSMYLLTAIINTTRRLRHASCYTLHATPTRATADDAHHKRNKPRVTARLRSCFRARLLLLCVLLEASHSTHSLTLSLSQTTCSMQREAK